MAKNTLWMEWDYFPKKWGRIESSFKAKGWDEAKSTLNVLKLKPEERAKYEREVENQRYKESLLYTAEVKGLKRGREEGLEEGLKKGKEEGLKEGIEKGLKRPGWNC